MSHILFLRAFGVKTDSRFSALTQRLTRRKKEENTVAWVICAWDRELKRPLATADP